MRLVWLTDIHLNFVAPATLADFSRAIAAVNPDVVLISGDIAEAPTLEEALASLKLPQTAKLFYVLGNHDFYRDRVEHVRSARRSSQTGTYLHGAGPVTLSEDTCLLGVDGWADGRHGRPRDSELVFTDWFLIDDFREADAVSNIEARLHLVQALADESASVLRQSLQSASAFRRIIVLTHIPPFSRPVPPERMAEAELWVPWLVCKATGDVLLQFADDNPDIELEIFAGHVHVGHTVKPRPNVVAHVGAATYRAPQIQRVWELASR